MVANCKEFTYSTDAAFQADLAAWLDTLRRQGTPARDLRLNFVTTTRVLVTALYGMAFAAAVRPGAFLPHEVPGEEAPDAVRG